MRIRAAGSIWVICFTASMPPISGMMISIVTRSGLSCLYFSTACLPFSASPTTVKPACDRMSLTIVRMNTASSQTSTVLLTLSSPLSDDLLNHRSDVEHDHTLAVDLHFSSYCRGNRHIVLARRLNAVERYILDVADVVHTHSDPPLLTLDDQDEPLLAAKCRSSENRAAVENGDDGAAEVDQAANRFGRPGQSCHPRSRYDLAECIHVAAELASAQLEHEQPSRRNRRFLYNFLLRREGDGVTHRSGKPPADRRWAATNARRRSHRVSGANPQAEASGSREACPSLDD